MQVSDEEGTEEQQLICFTWRCWTCTKLDIIINNAAECRNEYILYSGKLSREKNFATIEFCGYLRKFSP